VTCAPAPRLMTELASASTEATGVKGDNETGDQGAAAAIRRFERNQRLVLRLRPLPARSASVRLKRAGVASSRRRRGGKRNGDQHVDFESPHVSAAPEGHASSGCFGLGAEDGPAPVRCCTAALAAHDQFFRREPRLSTFFPKKGDFWGGAHALLAGLPISAEYCSRAWWWSCGVAAPGAGLRRGAKTSLCVGGPWSSACPCCVSSGCVA